MKLVQLKLTLIHNNTLCLRRKIIDLAPSKRQKRWKVWLRSRKLNLDMVSLNEEETRIKNLQIKLH